MNKGTFKIMFMLHTQKEMMGKISVIDFAYDLKDEHDEVSFTLVYFWERNFVSVLHWKKLPYTKLDCIATRHIFKEERDTETKNYWVEKSIIIYIFLFCCWQKV